jgi:hypothetical protein
VTCALLSIATAAVVETADADHSGEMGILHQGVEPVPQVTT